MTGDKLNKKANASQIRSQPTVVWENENARSVYANVFNVTGSQEEFVLSLGISHAWGVGQKELKVRMTDRILMNPFAAKRLAKLLNGVIREFESRYGTLEIETTQQGPAVPPKIQSRDSGATASRASKDGG